MNSSADIGSRDCPQCPACGAEGRFIHRNLPDRLFGAPGRWNVKKCMGSKCGLAWPDPMPLADEIFKAYYQYYTHAAQNFDDSPGTLKRLFWRMKKGYLASNYGYDPGTGSIVTKWLGRLLYLFPVRRSGVEIEIRRLHSVPNGRLLDIGCGAGEWLMAMRERGWEVEGIDFDEKAVRAARKNGLNVSLGSLEQQNFADNRFDALTLNHVIEHVPDPAGTLKECRRILKSNGKLFIATPNIESWGHALFKEHWRGLEPPRHLHIMSPSALNRLLHDAGFERIEVKTYTSQYVFYQSQLLKNGKIVLNGKNFEEQMSPLRSNILNLTEQILLRFSPECGECIGATARKK
jgi:2-polyprenyl-3-methyl-5-hydroxy-6-metoxy-1,4-benzoquinol methylase